MNNKSLFILINKLLLFGIKLLGFFTVFICVLAFSSMPYREFRRLSVVEPRSSFVPQWIICLSGNEYPSPDALGLFFELGACIKKYPHAQSIYSFPCNSNCDSKKAALIEELKLRTDSLTHFSIFTEGYNSYSQLYKIAEQLNFKTDAIMLIAPAPHTFRSIAVLKKMGFTNVCGYSSLSIPFSNEELSQISKMPYGRQVPMDLRYNFWNYLKYEIEIGREWIALLYYKINGWI
ncbi:MAG TPA: hypothetical protein PK006_01315 [Saprospiraceae bacterium]|nr:hypothetical protein [Saprospiraceae bacterium]